MYLLLWIDTFNRFLTKPAILRLLRFLQFYRHAITRYQLHAPEAYAIATAMLNDTRWYYSFRDIERIRKALLRSKMRYTRTDYGSGGVKKRQYTVRLADVARRSASSPRKGQQLFKLVQLLRPKTILELGTSIGIGTMYLASSMRSGTTLSLEGCPETAAIARRNLSLLGVSRTEVLDGPFEVNLAPVLEAIQTLDFIYFDGNHRLEPTLHYLETCLPYCTDHAVLVFDDIYWSEEMHTAWEKIKLHPRVRMTLDFYDFGVVSLNPTIRTQQHWKVVPLWWKPWNLF